MSHPNEDSPEMMQRRELLRRAAWLLGGTISAPAALAILQGCSARESAGEATDTALKTLSAAQLAIVAEIAEIMIPKTDTAGARDAGVPLFIDATLAAVYPQQDQERFKAGLGEFENIARRSGKTFLEREPAERAAFVKQVLVVAQDSDRERDDNKFMLMTRELTLLGYFTSQVGITANMEYVPVPTAFHGCVPLSQMKKHVYWE
ncbi:MAG TPA: gluconate 2-dehydrogenase subunit 3 family protein [Steroidobacteraceae bacterium]|nr:gluconate 2-dehydrogenase subunit 3 family protein [Steroidobacteraceae bacterium]